MKVNNLVSLILLLTLSLNVFLTSTESIYHRLRRQVITSAAASSSSSAGGGNGNFNPFSLSWLGPMSPPSNNFQVPRSMFPSGDQMRQVQNLITAARNFQDQYYQNMNRLQSLVNCPPTEAKTESIRSNGRTFQQTSTRCISSRPGSVAASVSSSSVPVDDKS